MHFLKNRLRMNRKGFIIFILLGFVNILSAQPKIQDSLEAYSYWAKRGIIEMVYVYMEDLDSLEEGEQKGKEKYKIKFIDKVSLPQSLDSISTFLIKSDWASTNSMVFRPLFNKFRNGTKLNNLFFEIEAYKGGVYTSEKWTEASKRIVESYEIQLVDLSEKARERKKTKRDPRKETNNYTTRKHWIIYLSIFILGIVLGGLLIFFVSRNNIYSILNYEKDKYLRDVKLSDEEFIFKYVGLLYILKKSKDDYKSEFEKLKNSFITNPINDEIEKLKKENAELKQVAHQSNNTIKDPETENTNEWNIKHSEKATRKLFFSMPENDGRFIIDNGESSNDGRKFFRIEYFEGFELGELFYISGDRDKRAINRLESNLKPACDIENIGNADSANNIEFIKSGKVVLINDSWVVDSDNKVKIRLI